MPDKPDAPKKTKKTAVIERPTINPQRLTRLLKKMVDIYSPSGKEEDVVSFLHGLFKRNGVPVVRQPVDEDRDNLVFEPDLTEPELVFVGHVDTVLAYDLDNYSYRQDGDTVYGLGTADMKGGCAAMVEAFLTLWENGHTDLPVALALVVGEEGTGDGARRLARECDYSAAIIGEPTGLKPCLSHYGYLEVQLWTEGRRMHASMASPGASAVNSMLNMLLHLTDHLHEQRPDLIYNIRDLASARSGFAVPDHCDAWMDLHLPPLTSLGVLTVELEELVQSRRKSKHGFNGDIDFSTIHAGYELPEKGALVEMLKEVYQRAGMPFEPEPFRSHSDANELWQAGIKPIILGPGDLAAAHTQDEFSSLSEIHKAAQMYVDIALSYVSRTAR